MDTSITGIDIAKRVFYVFGMSKDGRETFRKRLYRSEVLEFMAQCKSSRVALEACGGSNYWARELEKLGHKVSLIAPQYVKPFVKRNKNDIKDAEAICEAAQRPTMRYVPKRSEASQDIMNLHRIRERLVKNRTAIVNEMRGLLLEYGITIPWGRRVFAKQFLEVLATQGKSLSPMTQQTFLDLWGEYLEIDRRASRYEEQITKLCKINPTCKRLMTIPGVGVLTASALVATVADAAAFKNGREFAAWLGLTPREYSTGGKQKLYGISKRGDVHLRTLLVHGARVTLQYVNRYTDRRSLWAKDLMQRKGVNRSAVALANKNARIVWALLRSDEVYKEFPLAA